MDKVSSPPRESYSPCPGSASGAGGGRPAGEQARGAPGREGHGQAGLGLAEDLQDLGPDQLLTLQERVPQGPDQRLVEQVLDHHRGVAEGDPGQLGPQLVVVQLRVVGLGGQEVVDQLAPPAGVGDVEVEPAVEAAGPPGQVGCT
jgi:hypothetical protein